MPVLVIIEGLTLYLSEADVQRIFAVISGRFQKVVVFVEIMNGQNWDERKKKLNHNREYWVEKIEENIARDIRNDKALQARDWVPVHFWEKEVLKNLDSCIASIEEIVEVQRELLIDGKETVLYNQGDDEVVEY